MQCVLILVLVAILQSCLGSNEYFRQEGGKVTYQNPKYVKGITMFTYRQSRHSPYLTSANGTNLEPWGNNVTIILNGANAKLKVELFSLEFKVCDLFNLRWSKDWLKKYTNIPFVCPVPSHDYQFKDIELPPKEFPIDLPAGDYTAYVAAVTTVGREKIFEIKMNLRFENKSSG